MNPNNNLHENRAPPSRKPTNDNNVSTHVDTNSFTGTHYSLASDNKQIFSRNPKKSPCSNVPFSKLSDNINEYDCSPISHSDTTINPTQLDIEMHTSTPPPITLQCPTPKN